MREVDLTRGTSVGVPSLFLDRDGVINRKRHDHVKEWSEFEFLPGALEVLAEVREAGIPVIVITNQAVVGRGLIEPQRLMEIHGRMLAAVALAGGHIERIYACTHTPEDGCPCRKPGTEMFQRASAELGVSLTGSVMVGDSDGDVEAARRAGCRPILIGADVEARDVPTLPDLASALPLIWQLIGPLEREKPGLTPLPSLRVERGGVWGFPSSLRVERGGTV